MNEWHGPMWNDCGCCNYTRRAEGRLYCAWCLNVLRERLATLVHNLAIGAALCRAFRLGSKYADDLWDVDKHAGRWHPGCGRAVL